MERTFATGLMWHDSRGGEVETDVRVTYAFYAGYNGDRINPPEPASVEITAIVASDRAIEVPSSFYTDSELEAECMEDYVSMLADAEERRAEQARDDRMMKGF